VYFIVRMHRNMKSLVNRNLPPLKPCSSHFRYLELMRCVIIQLKTSDRCFQDIVLLALGVPDSVGLPASGVLAFVSAALVAPAR